MSAKEIRLQNVACLFFGLFFISIGLTVMSQMYFSQKIDAQIQSVSQLTDIKYPNWGQQPNPEGSTYAQTFNLYNLKVTGSNISAEKVGNATNFDYTFEYLNKSFEQGNSGRLDYINKWELVQRETETEKTDGAISTINLGADKIYNYDYYAPPQRRIAILYNQLVQTLSTDFLDLFYAKYLFEFFFNNEELVIETVFKPLRYDDVTAHEIYAHEKYGWDTPEKFKNWASLSLKGRDYSENTAFYESLIIDLGLTSQQISKLIFEKSTIYNMISALNGTILTKAMQAKSFAYTCDSFCNNEELAAFQLASAFLTNDTLFSSLGLNITSKDINTTFLGEVDYSAFCNNQKMQCLPESTKAMFFTNHFLGDFEKVDLLWKNRKRIDFIENLFDFPEGTGLSVVKYVESIYENYVLKHEAGYAWASTNYNHLEETVNKYYQLFLVELYARGFTNKYLNQGAYKCKDYFPVSVSQAVCAHPDWNLDNKLPAVRNYFKAYFFFQNQREVFRNLTEFAAEETINFFNDQNSSLFSLQLSQLNEIFSDSFSCQKQGNRLCEAKELFCLQWGSNQILSKLPSDIFQNKIKSINEWDESNILKGSNPDYFAVIGEKMAVNTCLDTLSSEKGIFSFFNLLKLVNDEGNNLKILKYIATNVVNINLDGVLIEKESNQLFQGFNSSVIDLKKQLNVSAGGAPWLDNQITLFKLNNKAEIKNNELLDVPQYDTINSGIYESDYTREISQIWGETFSSSKYVIYKGTKTDDEGKTIPVDIFDKYVTKNRVQGTNLLGFHPQLEEGENLQVYLSQAYRPFTLSYDRRIDEYDGKKITAFVYKVVSKENKSFVGIEELNRNYFVLGAQSEFIVEPQTGNTIEFKINYSIQTSPSFLSYLFSSNSQNLIPLYDSQINYKKGNLQHCIDITDLQNSKDSYFLLGCIATGLLLAATMASFIYFRMKVSKLQKQTLLGDSHTDED